MSLLNWNLNWVGSFFLLWLSIRIDYYYFIITTQCKWRLILIRKVQDDNVSSVSAIVHGNRIKFPLDYPDACSPESKSGLTCPLRANTTYTYVQTLPVKFYYPPVSHQNKLRNILFFIHFLEKKKKTLMYIFIGRFFRL